ncbi:MAG: methyltransferase domain-containing protein [Candidatus Hydrogenedentes bacterium]|nr:methyltransferase domain-containing protein [Candidatus Hydrogenedentota bacterium]
MRRWNADSVISLSRAFTESRILLTAVELGVFPLLARGGKSLDEITGALHSAPRGTAILLDALSAMGLLAKENDRYTCPQDVAALLTDDAPTSVLPMVKHNASLWGFWSELTGIVRQGGANRAPQVFHDDDEIAAFVGAMHVVARESAAALAKAVRAHASARLLDIGGATGTYAEAFLREYPAMRATVFDRPSVIELARTRLANTDLMDRFDLAGGDFYADELPGGHDLALLSAIIHQNSPEQNVALYERAFRAMTPGGRLLIRDFVLSPDRTQPIGGALFAVNMLAATAGGNCYTLGEIRETLEKAGFTGVELLIPAQSMDAVVEAFKP